MDGGGQPVPVKSKEVGIFIEAGKKRTFAGSVAWPGWCRSGRDEAAAVQALFDAGSRYAGVISAAGLNFEPPGDVSGFRIVERVEGNATTDFGAPDAPLRCDGEEIDVKDYGRFVSILKAGWCAFDQAMRAGKGKQLRKGPRGGGRDMSGIIKHVMLADESYLHRIGWGFDHNAESNSGEALARVRAEILRGFEAVVNGELPAVGPRGGKRWSPRFFIRRVVWHVLDHAWEIEERILHDHER
jgi:hypothetical protein